MNVYSITGKLETTGAMLEGAPVLTVGGHRGKWSGASSHIPQMGDTVLVLMNEFGLCTVTGYFIEGGSPWLGVECKVHRRPDWHVKQNGRDWDGVIHVFGCEVRPVSRPFWLRRTVNSAKSKGHYRMEVIDTATGAILDTRNTGNAYTAAVVLEAAQVEGARRCVLSYSRTVEGANKLFNDYARRCGSSALKLAGIAMLEV